MRTHAHNTCSRSARQTRTERRSTCKQTNTERSACLCECRSDQFLYAAETIVVTGSVCGQRARNRTQPRTTMLIVSSQTADVETTFAQFSRRLRCERIECSSTQHRRTLRPTTSIHIQLHNCRRFNRVPPLSSTFSNSVHA